MDNKNVETINKLNHLIAIAEDGKQGYKNASDDVDDSSMKALFSRLSAEREGYSAKLRAEVRSLGEEPKDDGGPLGVMHRVWMDLKSTFTSGDKNAIINACITGEEAAISAYEGALEEDYIVGEIRNVISEQLTGIRQAMDSIRTQRSAGNS